MTQEQSKASTHRMDPAIKAKWVAALRSGEYRQSNARALNDGDGGFCCLGVLCDLYAKESGIEWEWDTPYAMRLRDIGGGCYYPPSPVREWAAFHEDEQPVKIEGERVSVAVHNDGVGIPRRTFAEIAVAIEEQL